MQKQTPKARFLKQQQFQGSTGKEALQANPGTVRNGPQRGAPGTSGFSENSSRIQGLPSPSPFPAFLLPHSQASGGPPGIAREQTAESLSPSIRERGKRSIYCEKCPCPNNKKRKEPPPQLSWAINRSPVIPWSVTGCRGLENWNKGPGGFSGSQLLSEKLKEPSLWETES